MNKKMFLALMVSATVLFSVLYVRSRFLLVELSYKTLSEQKLKKELEQKKQQKMLELAQLRSPSRIEDIASRKLGLTRNSQGELIFIRAKGVSVP